MDIKIVLYTQRVEYIESYNERRDCADQRIAEFIKTCGFLPVPVPNDMELAIKMVSFLAPCGIVLTGGNSLVKYGGSAPERDETDKALIKIAIEKQIPLFGFCRGMQSILDYYGNDLIEIPGHVATSHMIEGVENSIEVNSYHRQGCLGTISDELVSVMKSSDGVIEKAKHKSLPIIAIMWHPERNNPFLETDQKMIRELFGGKA